MIQEEGYSPLVPRSGSRVIGATANRLMLVDASSLLDVTNVPYESGTWTPTLTFDTPGDLSVAYSVQVGDYRRCGDVVSAAFRVALTTWTHTTASGSLRIGGFPFSFLSPSGGHHVRCGVLSACNQMTLTGYIDAMLLGVAGQVYAYIALKPATGNYTPAGTTHAPTTALLDLRGAITYRT